MEYAASCWSPTSDYLKNKIEMVQHSAVKFVTNIYPEKGNYESFSVTKLLEGLQWDTLKKRRQQLKLTMVFKILNDHLILSPDLLPKVLFDRPPRKCNEPNVGTKNQLREPPSRLNTTRKTFFFSAPTLWNTSVTPSQANAPSVDSFKRYFTN